jgi:hypothetical protein
MNLISIRICEWSVTMRSRHLRVVLVVTLSIIGTGKAQAVQNCSDANACVDWQNTFSGGGAGLRGASVAGAGVSGYSAVYGVTGHSPSGYGIAGDSVSGIGVYGSTTNAGTTAILGTTNSGAIGVHGYSGASNGVGVRGHSVGGSGVYASIVDSSQGNAIVGDANWSWSAWAGNFFGDIQVRGVWELSDARLKSDVANLSNGLSQLMKLRPVTFKWKKDGAGGRGQLGFIAQDVQKVFPEVVRGDPDAQMLSVNYTELLPVVIRAIQEQEARLTALEQRSAVTKSSLFPSGVAEGFFLASLPFGLIAAYRARRKRPPM